MIGKAVAAFCRLGWSELAARHRAELELVVPPEHLPAVFMGGLSMVEQSATNLAIKYNVRIPWGDELVVGLGVGIATLGIAGKLKKKDPANDNHAAAAARARDATPPPTSANTNATTDEPIVPPAPSAAAGGGGPELVL